MKVLASWAILWLFLIFQLVHEITMALQKAGVQAEPGCVRPCSEELELRADLPEARPDAGKCSSDGGGLQEHPRAPLV